MLKPSKKGSTTSANAKPKQSKAEVAQNIAPSDHAEKKLKAASSEHKIQSVLKGASGAQKSSSVTPPKQPKIPSGKPPLIAQFRDVKFDKDSSDDDSDSSNVSSGSDSGSGSEDDSDEGEDGENEEDSSGSDTDTDGSDEEEEGGEHHDDGVDITKELVIWRDIQTSQPGSSALSGRISNLSTIKSTTPEKDYQPGATGQPAERRCRQS
nr:clumping factor A-like [Pocillopora verrucosa]